MRYYPLPERNIPKLVGASFCLAVLLLQLTCLASFAQSFGDAFTSVVIKGEKCICRPVDVRQVETMRGFLTKTAKSLQLRWHLRSLPEELENTWPAVVAYYDEGRWSVKCDGGKDEIPAYRLARQLVERELQHRHPPIKAPFAVVFTFDILEDYVETNVEGTVVAKDSSTENWKPFEDQHRRVVIVPERDVDFGPYMADLQRRIRRIWSTPKFDKSKRVACVFKIHSDGSISGNRVITSSGITEMDQAALKAIRTAAPFLKLPVGAPPDVDIQFTFDHNVVIHSCDVGDPVYGLRLSSPDDIAVRRAQLHQSPIKAITGMMGALPLPVSTFQVSDAR